MARKQKIKCKCGATYRVPANSAGKKATCKKCGQTVVIPQPTPAQAAPLSGTPVAAAPNPYGSISAVAPTSVPDAVHSCPECGRNIGKGKVVCIYCGYHTGLGKVLQTNALSTGETLARGGSTSDLFVPGTTGVLVLAIGIIAVLTSWFLCPFLEGPQFLAYYCSLFLFFGTLVIVGRLVILDHDIFNDAALIALLGSGAVRILYSVSEERYKFLLLILGMAIAFGVFFISRVGEREPANSSFVNESGGISFLPLVFTFLAGALILTLVYFVEPIQFFVIKLFMFVLIGTVLAIGKGLEIVTGSTYMTSSGSSGGWTGGGGCGGGCGGGGCGGCGG